MNYKEAIKAMMDGEKVTNTGDGFDLYLNFCPLEKEFYDNLGSHWSLYDICDFDDGWKIHKPKKKARFVDSISGYNIYVDNKKIIIETCKPIPNESINEVRDKLVELLYDMEIEVDYE